MVLGGIYMSPIPAMDYNLLYHERVIRSVANNTRQDGEDFLRIAAEIPIHTRGAGVSVGGGQCGVEYVEARCGAGGGGAASSRRMNAFTVSI